MCAEGLFLFYFASIYFCNWCVKGGRWCTQGGTQLILYSDQAMSTLKYEPSRALDLEITTQSNLSSPPTSLR